MKHKWTGQKLAQPFTCEYDIEDNDVSYMNLNDLRSHMTTKERENVEDQVFTSGFFCSCRTTHDHTKP